MGMPASGAELVSQKLGKRNGPLFPNKMFLDVGLILNCLLRLCKFVIRLRPAAGVPAFMGLPRWDPVSDWPGFEAKSGFLASGSGLEFAIFVILHTRRGPR